MAQVEALKKQNERLKEDLERKRIKVSEAAADLIQYCGKTDENINDFKKRWNLSEFDLTP